MSMGWSWGSETEPWTKRAPLVLAVLAVAGTTALVMYFAGQPLLDRHAFRQTQTAITSYWFIREGYKLAYETPIAGYPWLLPFEFPLYQAVVAAVSQTTGWPLGLVGRLVSYMFLLSCIPVASAIIRRLNLPSPVFAIFVALTFTSPVYVYWGRAFLIETCSLFLALMAIKFALDYILGGHASGRLLAFSVFMTLCMLQKVTTGLPVLLVIWVLLAVDEARQSSQSRRGRVVALCLAITLPLAAVYAWTSFADALKLASPLGPALTSSALSTWNWGTLSQRVSAIFWRDVVMYRVLFLNLGGIVGAGLVIAALSAKAEVRIKIIIAAAVALGLLPLLLFTNLHIVHDYYQSSNVMFLIFAVATALGAVIMPRVGSRAGLGFLLALVVANGLGLVQSGYLAAMHRTFDASHRDVAVSEVLARELPDDKQFVSFGNAYSATFAYLSGRKSFAVPDWFNEFSKVIARPADYVQPGHLGAVVACSKHPDRWVLMDWAAGQDGWKVGEVAGCAIAVPARPLPSAPQDGTCRGPIDRVEIITQGGRRAIALSGWSGTTGNPATAPDAIFVGFKSAEGVHRVIDTLRVPRADAGQSPVATESSGFGVSGFFPADLPAGSYAVNIIQRRGSQDIACPTSAMLTIP